eukprot:4631616-Amphidinium_carterae.1
MCCFSKSSVTFTKRRHPQSGGITVISRVWVVCGCVCVCLNFTAFESSRHTPCRTVGHVCSRGDALKDPIVMVLQEFSLESKGTAMHRCRILPSLHLPLVDQMSCISDVKLARKFENPMKFHVKTNKNNKRNANKAEVPPAPEVKHLAAENFLKYGYLFKKSLLEMLRSLALNQDPNMLTQAPIFSAKYL